MLSYTIAAFPLLILQVVHGQWDGSEVDLSGDGGEVDFYNGRGCSGSRIDPITLGTDQKCHSMASDWQSYLWRRQNGGFLRKQKKPK